MLLRSCDVKESVSPRDSSATAAKSLPRLARQPSSALAVGLPLVDAKGLIAATDFAFLSVSRHRHVSLQYLAGARHSPRGSSSGQRRLGIRLSARGLAWVHQFLEARAVSCRSGHYRCPRIECHIAQLLWCVRQRGQKMCCGPFCHSLRATMPTISARMCLSSPSLATRQRSFTCARHCETPMRLRRAAEAV